MLTIRNRERVSNIERLINEVFENRVDENKSKYFTPNINIKENKDRVIIEAELAGVNKKDIKVIYENGALKISGERKGQNNEDRDYSHRSEIRYGNFQRVVPFNEEFIVVDSIKANYLNGILTVLIDKTEEKKPKEIEVSIS